MNDCYDLIKVRREGRHQKTLDRQISKFHRLCQKSNNCRSNIEHGEHGGLGRIDSKHPLNHSHAHRFNNRSNEEQDQEQEQEQDGEDSTKNGSEISLRHL